MDLVSLLWSPLTPIDNTGNLGGRTYSAMVPFENGFYEVGGFGALFFDVIRYFGTDTWTFADTNLRLNTGRYFAGAMMVSPQMINCA